MNSLIMGINACIHGLNYHDPSCCLLRNDKIIFAMEEERLNGIKHSCGKFPLKATEQCKQIASSTGSEIKHIAISYDPRLWKFRTPQSIDLDNVIEKYTLLIRSVTGLHNAQVHFYEHHKTHAASAFYASGFQNALCVVVDGVGEIATASVWIANESGIEKIDECAMPNSLGYFYAAATAFLGFEPWNAEGKLMALAPYGNDNPQIKDRLQHIFDNKYNNYNVSSLIKDCLINGYMLDVEKSKQAFANYFQHKPRNREDEINEWHKDFAYAIQNSIENAVLQYISQWMQRTNLTNICCAGGLFMNCKMNGVLRRKLGHSKLFIQPVAGDAGTALGASFLCAAEYMYPQIPHFDLQELSLGIEYDNKAVLDAILKAGINFKFKYSNNIPEDTAKLINNGKIIAWFQGRSELGARALGHRSILAAPTSKHMADLINLRIKHRETWRPFACSILEDMSDVVLKNYDKSIFAGYMIEASNVNNEWISQMGAVIHQADFSTRPQIVRYGQNNTLFYEMIRSYYLLTGIPYVLNTSFNDKGQPIILTPEEAINFFTKQDIDALVIQNYILTK